MQNVLVLVRHGESEWNRLNLFTGWKNPDLTDKGVDEAKRAGQLLGANAIRFDIAFTSLLTRAQRTLALILGELGQPELETIRDEKLNERDYGELAGLNKDDARAKWGDAKVHAWRRSYDVPPPGGESLEMTGQRTLPYYESRIWPEVAAGRNVIVAAHGNSLRSVIMRLERLTPAEIVAREVHTGVPLVYRLRADGSVASMVELKT
jgi:2,3-bisphosphoglycerate-dependent phosphoglycerate mutase